MKIKLDDGAYMPIREHPTEHLLTAYRSREWILNWLKEEVEE